MHFMNENERKNAENEVYLLRVLVGPTIIRYYESFTEHDSINIIMEYAEGGSVYDVI
jgi:NIMA (never in mitosis gene a)-related kinase 1/4/5